jgi:monomeric isocitrate dehydrogenase
VGTIRDWVGLAVARARASNTKVGKGDPIRDWVGLAVARARASNYAKVGKGGHNQRLGWPGCSQSESIQY